jgi:hypothetical protein
MSSVSKKDNAELTEEQKQIHYKPEDLKDTDAEDEFQEGDKKGFRQQVGKPKGAAGNGISSSNASSSSNGVGKPSNEKLEKDQKQIHYKPEDLKDTDAEDEYKEGGEKGFRKQTGKPSKSSSGDKKPNDEKMEVGKQMKMAPDEVKDADKKTKSKL